MAYEIINYDQDFEAIVNIIETVKLWAMKVVNIELIEMYWQIGKYISDKTLSSEWGKGVVKAFADYLQKRYHAVSGFSSQNIW